MLRIAGGGMNIEAYDAEALRKIVRLLEYENRLLKDKLKKENIPYDEINPFEETIENAEEYDLDQGARIVHPTFITEKMAIRFFSMFWGREDVYARRGKNGGYFPQCANRWNDEKKTKETIEKIKMYLEEYKESKINDIAEYINLCLAKIRALLKELKKVHVILHFLWRTCY